MPLSWNEIKARAVAFSHKWKDETSEDAEAKPFWVDFFNIFGIDRKRVATFEERVKKLDGSEGYIDLLWKGVILVEHKSFGKDLDKAQHQASDYLHGLKDYELPRCVLVCDFRNFRLIDLTNDSVTEFTLDHLHNHVHLFGFMIGYITTAVIAHDPVNTKAAEKMGAFHDRLKDAGYEGHALEMLLVRMLFCLFADDTGIFSKRQFQDYIEQRTSVDGSDLGMHLAQLCQVLDTPESKRPKTLDEQLGTFPYINGSLFAENLPIAAFDGSMREALLEACALDWSRISPAIFGSLFQSVMNPKERRAIGAHYTSEKNILKVIGPLFLDDLKAEFEACKKNEKKLENFHKKIAALTFLDPACGCGNFLIIGYRELRLLEHAVIRELYASHLVTDISTLLRVSIAQFHGIEIEEFPARIAELALWLIDHQMNLAVSEEFGQYFVRIPLSKIETVICANALRQEWPKTDFILGNPPFSGKTYQTKEQREDVAFVFDGMKNASDLDFVACWHWKAANQIQGTKTKVAFVSTNSITQGEQAPVLWRSMLYNKGIKIHFAHRTFRWNNDAKGMAAVHCVIIGFANFDIPTKKLFEYPDISGEPILVETNNISPYLTPGPDIVVEKHSTPLSPVSPMRCGNKPTDDGNLILSQAEKDALVEKWPGIEQFIKPFVGSEEFINGNWRWCFWLVDVNPSELKKFPPILDRIEKVRTFRKSSTAEPTRKMAEYPTRFFFLSQPKSSYILIPEVSSEKRTYIPIGFMNPDVICSNTNFLTETNSVYSFGILTSGMHMSWMRTIAGRLESRYRYSGSMVYNNFPWPMPTPTQKSNIETAAQSVLDIRAQFTKATLADLYDPLTMPPVLLKAHHALDKAVDAAYGKKKFANESERVAFLFERYRELVNPLGIQVAGEKMKKQRLKKQDVKLMSMSVKIPAAAIPGETVI